MLLLGLFIANVKFEQRSKNIYSSINSSYNSRRPKHQWYIYICMYSNHLGWRYFLFVLDCPIYEIYTKNSTFGLCSQMTEELQTEHQYLCMERCLDTPGCRAASFAGERCILHDCDCHVDAGPPFVFMWKYCLTGNGNLSVTVINS